MLVYVAFYKLSNIFSRTILITLSSVEFVVTDAPCYGDCLVQIPNIAIERKTAVVKFR